MEKNIKNELTNTIIDLSLAAKRLADDISILKETNPGLFTKLGNRLLRKAYMKTKKLSVILMEASFAIETDAIETESKKKVITNKNNNYIYENEINENNEVNEKLTSNSFENK